MKIENAIDAAEKLLFYCYNDRNPQAVISLVTDEIKWIGAEMAGYVKGKARLAEALERGCKKHPKSFCIEINETNADALDEKTAVVVLEGRMTAVPIGNLILSLSVTAILKETETGWLVDGVHMSVPYSQTEAFTLQKELDETHKKEKALMESIPGGVAIYRMKKDGRAATDYVSESLAKMCGYEADEFLAYLKDDALVNLVADDVPQLMKTVVECIENKHPINATYYVYTKKRDKILLRLDANIIPDAKLGDDDVALLYAVHTAVSDSARTMLNEQKYYRMVLNMTDTAYFEWDKENGFYSSDKFAQYAISNGGFSSIMGDKDGIDSIHPDDLPALQNYMIKTEKAEGGHDVTVRMKMQDGSYRWTEVTGYSEYDENGNFSRLIGVMRDVDKEWEDQKKRLEAALDEAQSASRAKTEFLSRVSHDMRTPLNGILGLTMLIKDSVQDPKLIHDISQLEVSGKYLLDLINDTLDVSRIESGKLELHPSVCDSRSLFNSVLALSKPGVEAKKMHVDVKTDKLTYPMLYIDIGRVEQIMMNIIGNAVKFTPEGGCIDVTMTNISTDENKVVDRVVVKDNGMGISKDFLPHIFEPFSQENSTIRNSNQGTGLGMIITKQLIELMGGEISVESEQGKGTCVTYTLVMPVANDEQISEWKKQQSVTLENDFLRNKRILLCEDHPLNAQIATRILNGKGVIVERAENGKVGVDMFDASSVGYYDAVLMDIRMPVMDGLEASRSIRALPRSDARTIPIIAMTANAFSDDVDKTVDAGMNAHLSKPIETDKLFSTLEEQMKYERYFSRQKVLVVDDVEVNRVVIKESLTQDFDVFEAADGQSALDLLEKYRDIDVVITDIQMPGMNGIQLIKNIRSNAKYKKIAIIANTQYGDPGQEEMLLSIGANDFVYKPTTPKIVEMRVRNVLRRI